MFLKCNCLIIFCLIFILSSIHPDMLIFFAYNTNFGLAKGLWFHINVKFRNALPKMLKCLQPILFFAIILMYLISIFLLKRNCPSIRSICILLYPESLSCSSSLLPLCQVNFHYCYCYHCLEKRP